MQSGARCLTVAVLSLFAMSAGAAPPAPAAADLVLRNGAVYTLDAGRTWAEAVAVRKGRIVYVGAESGIGRWIGARTEVVDLAGRMLLPGFHDSHVHLVTGGLHASECRLGGLATQAEVAAAIRRCAQERPQAAWLRGGGWELPVFPRANPRKEVLDEIVPDRAAFLSAADGHSAWLNSRALALAGITRETPDPVNGRIERDPVSGEPTGTLREAAVDLVRKVLPEHTEDDFRAGLRRGLAEAARFGIVSVQDAAVDEILLRAYADLDRQNALTVRVVAAIEVDPAKGAEDVPRLVALRRTFHGHRLRATAAKIFVDGVIESGTAALLDPYVGTDSRGQANIAPEALDRLVAALDREGFQVHVHAIGDRAVRMALDAFEKARAAGSRRDARPQIAHLELIDPQDVPRFRRLGVIADFQPLWAYDDSYVKELTVPVLGEERSRRIYPIGSVARTGAMMACGSDWDVTSINPLEAIQVGLTRRDPAAGPGPAWLPDETVDLPALLACYTIGGAWANFEEHESGSIEAGKAADLIVLDRNLFETPRHEIARAKVLLTLVEGKETFRDPGFAKSP